MGQPTSTVASYETWIGGFPSPARASHPCAYRTETILYRESDEFLVDQVPRQRTIVARDEVRHAGALTAVDV